MVRALLLLLPQRPTFSSSPSSALLLRRMPFRRPLPSRRRPLPTSSSPSPSSSSPSSSSDVEGNRTRFAQTLILHTPAQTMASSCGHNRQFAYLFPSHRGVLPYCLGTGSYLHSTQNSPNRRTQRDKQPSLLKLHLPSSSEAPTLNTSA